MVTKIVRLILFLLALAMLASACEQPAQDPAPPISDPSNWDINLGTLQGGQRYIDLSKHGQKVVIGGKYKGDRLVLQKASNKHVIFDNATLEGTHPEDLIAIEGDVSGLKLEGKQTTLKGGGITFWGLLRSVEVTGFAIDGTHTGLRATEDVPHTNVRVINLTVKNSTHEGIYIGSSKDRENKGNEVRITGCYLENIGWDGIQVGNSTNVYIFANTIKKAATAQKEWQDYAITLNYCRLVFVEQNTIQGTVSGKIIQDLTSRTFLHE